MHKIHLLRGGEVGEQQIGVLGRRSHVIVDDNNHLALLVVGQDFVRAFDVRVLVNEAVTAKFQMNLIGALSFSAPRTPSVLSVIS